MFTRGLLLPVAVTLIWCIKRSEIGWAGPWVSIPLIDALCSSKVAFSCGSVSFWIAASIIYFFQVRRIVIFLDFCLWSSQRNFPITGNFPNGEKVPVLPMHHISFSLNYWEQTRSRAIILLENRETFAVYSKQKLLILDIVVGITFKRNMSRISLVLCMCHPSFFPRCDLITGPHADLSF